jgi:integrase/recombinase XerD
MEDKVEQFLSSLQTERGFSENTIAAYRNDLQQFIAFLTNPPQEDRISAVSDWSALGDDHLAAYLLQLRSRDYAASTVARKTAALKSFCSFLRRQGIMGEGIGMKLSSPKVNKYTPKGISEEEVKRLLQQPLNQLPDRPESIRDRAMLEVLYATGMRVSELVSLNTDDVDLERGDIKCQGKAGRSRVVPLSEQAITATREYLDRSRAILLRAQTPSLFVNHRGGRLTRQGFWLILKSYAQRAGIAAITPHTLRHSYAIHALSHGEELADLQRKLGHVNISTTQIYRNLAIGDRPVGTTGSAVMEQDGNGSADPSSPDVLRLSGSFREVSH